MRNTSSGSANRANLVDVQTAEGDLYFWSDRAIAAPAVIAGADDDLSNYTPWLLQPPAIRRSRSMSTDTCSFTLANVAGDTLARDFERILRRSALEGALFVYRLWNPTAEAADEEFEGTLSVSSVDVATASLTGKDIHDVASREGLSLQLGETCQLVWGLARCGATGETECQYTLQTCQVEERFVGVTNTFYDKNFAEAMASVSTQAVNRRRGV